MMDTILKLTRKLKKAKTRTLALSSNDLSSGTSSKNSKSTSGGGDKDVIGPAGGSDDSEDTLTTLGSDMETPMEHQENDSANVERPKSLPLSSASASSGGGRNSGGRNSFPENTITEDDYVQSPLLASAIASFSKTVSVHMLKVVMTAVHMKWKLHQLKLQQKMDLANVPREQSATSKHISSDESIGSESSTIFSTDCSNPSSSTNAGNIMRQTRAPPPPPGAVWFTQQELGSGGFTFMQSFIQSQMFCNYAQQQDEEEEAKNRQRRAEKDEQKKVKDESDDGVSLMNDVDDEEVTVEDDGMSDGQSVDLKPDKHGLLGGYPSAGSLSLLPSGGRRTPRLDEHVYPLLTDDSHDYARMMSQPDASPRKDPLISLFAIMMTGSYPLQQEKVDDLLTKGHALYTPDTDTTEAEVLDGEFNNHDFDIEGLRTRKYPIYIEDTSAIEATLLCNGRCMGLANTPSCTHICLELWEQKAQQLRRQASVVDIIRRRGASMAPGVRKSISPRKQKAKLPSGSKLTNLDLFRSELPKRHKRETIGQYLHRTSLITGRSEEDISAELNVMGSLDKAAGTGIHSHSAPLLSSSSATTLLHTDQMTRTHSEEILPSSSEVPAFTTTKHGLDSNGNHSIGHLSTTGPSFQPVKVSPAVKAITQYRQRRSAMKRHQLLRLQQERAAILIQKEFRGYIVRSNIVFIISSLLHRKKRSMSNMSESDRRYPTSSSSSDSTDGLVTGQVSDTNDGKDEGEMVVRSESEDTDGILLQSDHQFFAQDLVDPTSVDGGNSDRRFSTDRKSSPARSVSCEERTSLSSRSSLSPVQSAHSSSNGYLLDGLLPARRNKKHTSLSLSPSSVFTRGRANSRQSGVKNDESNVAQKSNSEELIRRSQSDNLYLPKESGPATNEIERVPLTAELRQKSFSQLLSIMSNDSADYDYDDAIDMDTITGGGQDDRLFDGVSPRYKSPSNMLPTTDEGDNGSESPVIFDESLLNEDGIPIPVQSLGLRAGDILSQPQQLCVVTLWQILRTGILVLKHGRSGRPKNRTLYCDDNLRVLFWRDADNTGSAAADYQHQDIDRTKATRRSSFNVFSKQDSSREVVLRDVLEVRSDLTTDVMRRSLAKKYVFEDQPSLVISLILKDRTLDFQIDEKQWEPVFNALQIIVDFYQHQVQLLDK
mmetsp:Transcript_192/g.367  ORF Transcript_192/g.367 Transcript_192/m.367 type:complete len:1164 (-) Transcript_192:164-3655(-)